MLSNTKENPHPSLDEIRNQIAHQGKGIASLDELQQRLGYSFYDTVFSVWLNCFYLPPTSYFQQYNNLLSEQLKS